MRYTLVVGTALVAAVAPAKAAIIFEQEPNDTYTAAQQLDVTPYEQHHIFGFGEGNGGEIVDFYWFGWAGTLQAEIVSLDGGSVAFQRFLVTGAPVGGATPSYNFSCCSDPHFTFGILGSGNYRIDIYTTTVPEPATWAMLISGFCLIGGAMRRRSAVGYE